MEEPLRLFLARGKHLCDESVTWGNGTLPLKIKYYLCNEQPPLKYVSSVRAIVFQNQSILVVTEKNGHIYILPGGRVEKGEIPVKTLKREVLEETGWTLLKERLLGLMHFHHLGQRPEDYEYPYPDFIWPIYIAEASTFVDKVIQPDDYVFESHFLPIEEVRNLPIREGELLLLEAALQLRRNLRNI